MIFPDGRTQWGNGNPGNIPFETVLNSLLEAGINQEAKVLDVGSGRYKIHDICVGVDAYTENDRVNVKSYMWDMPFHGETVDTIFCFHALEHISKYQVLPTLDEFSRVLKPGGKILLLVPNFEWVLQAFLNNPTPQWEMDMIYGVQTHDQTSLNEGEFHRTGFTPRILRTYLKQIPFKELEWFNVNAYNQENIGVLAQKEK